MDGAGKTKEGPGPSRRARSRSGPKGRTGRKETSAHRRARRLRAADRLLLQVTAAAVRVATHHAGRPPVCLIPLLDRVRGSPQSEGQGAKGNAAGQGRAGAARGGVCSQMSEHENVALVCGGKELVGVQHVVHAEATPDGGSAAARQGGSRPAVQGQRGAVCLDPGTTGQTRDSTQKADSDLVTPRADDPAGGQAAAPQEAGLRESGGRNAQCSGAASADKDRERDQQDGGFQASVGLGLHAGEHTCDQCGATSKDSSKVTNFWWRGYSRCQQCQASGEGAATTAAPTTAVVPPISDFWASEALFCSRSPWPFLRSAHLRAYGGASTGSAVMLLRHIRGIAPEAVLGSKGGPHVALLGQVLANIAGKRLQAATRVPPAEGRRADVTADHGRKHWGATSISGAAAADESGQPTRGDADARSRLRPPKQKGSQKPKPEEEEAIRRLAGGAAATRRR